jgi:hypothetical protein
MEVRNVEEKPTGDKIHAAYDRRRWQRYIRRSRWLEDCEARAFGNAPSQETWVSIEPGWTVRDGPGYIEVEHEGVRVH